MDAAHNAELVPHYTEHIYATKSGVALPLRVWRSTRDAPDAANYADPSDPVYEIASSVTARTGLREPSPPTPKPWLLWSHGGAFLGGSVAPPPWVLPAFLPWAHVVSYGYRLAPAVGLGEMEADGADAAAWCAAHLPQILPDIDVHSYAVGGLSAGGALALLNALAAEGDRRTNPRAVLSAYAMSDLADTHFEPHFTGPGYDPGVLSGRFSEGELEKAIEARDASAALTALPNRDDPDGPGVLARAASGIRGLLGAEDPAALAADVKIHMAATGRIVRILTRREMYTDDESWRAAAAEVSPVSRVGRGFPPTALLHGIADRTVPVDQTVRLAKTLADADVPVKEVYVPGADHCFDFEITGPGSAGWDDVILPLVQFVRSYLDPEGSKESEGAEADPEGADNE